MRVLMGGDYRGRGQAPVRYHTRFDLIDDTRAGQMDKNNRILVTGGTGFIGSHTVVLLQQAGYEVLVLDNLSNSKRSVLERIARITGRTPDFVQADVRDAAALKAVFEDKPIQAVLHFAGLKAVGESVRAPLAYYDHNMGGTLQLLKAMQAAQVRTLIFSSSATVYGEPQRLPLTEDHPRRATNPYGHTKLLIEDMLENLHASEPGWRMARLRYFNPVGAHPSALLGEAPQGVPNNLMPYVAQVALGQRERLQVFGGDWPTPDGTGVRDYIHVMDLAQGHIQALQYCERQAQTLLSVNLGTGRGHSVLEMVRAFEAASGQTVAHELVARRPGDVAASWADATLAQQLLGWQATRTLEQMCADTWRWVSGKASGQPPGKK